LNVGGAGIALADPNRIEPHNWALRDAARAVGSWAYAEGVRKTQQLSRRIVEGFLAGFDLGFRCPSLRIPEPAFQAVLLPAYEPWMTGTHVYAEAFWRHDAVGLRDPDA